MAGRMGDPQISVLGWGKKPATAMGTKLAVLMVVMMVSLPGR